MSRFCARRGYLVCSDRKCIACHRPADPELEAAPTIATLRAETARVCELAERLERVTLPHQPRYSCVVLAHHLLERALRFLVSPDADEENTGRRGRPAESPRSPQKVLRSEADRPMDGQEESGPPGGCNRRAALEER